MVKNLIGHVRCNPQSGHPGYTGPAQVVQAPPSHAGQLVQPALGSAKLVERFGSEPRQDIWLPLACAFQHGDGLWAEMDYMGLGILGP